MPEMQVESPLDQDQYDKRLGTSLMYSMKDSKTCHFQKVTKVTGNPQHI